MINLHYNVAVKNCFFSINRAQLIVTKLAHILKLKNIELELNIVSDYTIKKLNYNYRGINKKTDVLAFAWQEDKKLKSDFFGQIYISYPQIIRQAKLYKISISEELTRMIIHGLLHLLGYDHQKDEQAKIMFDIQEKLVKYEIKK